MMSYSHVGEGGNKMKQRVNGSQGKGVVDCLMGGGDER